MAGFLGFLLMSSDMTPLSLAGSVYPFTGDSPPGVEWCVGFVAMASPMLATHRKLALSEAGFK